MIEGIKPTVSGNKLSELLNIHALYHAERANVYIEQIANFRLAEVESAQYTNGDPIRALESKLREHENSKSHLLFLSANIDLGESYVLDTADLQLLGIVSGRY